MDAAWFLKQRTKFIRFFYEQCVQPLEARRLQIENGEPPFDPPPYFEDEEPPYLEEYMEGETAIDIVGLTCISMLSDSLKLYFEALRGRLIGFKFPQTKDLWKPGFVQVYKGALGHILKTDWSDCPVDFGIIEQIVLARNRAQHGASLTTMNVDHDEHSLKKYANPFFAKDSDLKMFQDTGGDPGFLFPPSLTVTRENLFKALEQIELLADWIDGKEDAIWAWKRGDKP